RKAVIAAVLLGGMLLVWIAGEVFACTTAVISGSATASGRPLLWKNRDRSIEDQEVVYFNDGLYPYVTITNAGDSIEAWGGANSTGFAIEDANNWNTTDPAGPDDDGTIIKLALQTCVTVDDFQDILDSTSIAGHTEPAIFGVIDAFGGAAMFETFVDSYVRYDADDPEDAPLGVLVRSNWSYAGSTQGRLGVFRHNRSKDFIEAAVEGDSLDLMYMLQTVMRDLHPETGFNPYPLPTQTQFGSLPLGWTSTYGAICRRLSVSGLVVEGILPGEDPLLTTCWIIPMAEQYGVALPFWVAAGLTPEKVNGDSTAPLSDEGLRIKAFAQHADWFHDSLDTYILYDGLGGGLHTTTFPLEEYVVARTNDSLDLWRSQGIVPAASMSSLSSELADSVYAVLSQWPRPGDSMLPPKPIGDLTIAIEEGVGLILNWSAVTENTHDLPLQGVEYSIWRYSEYPAAGSEIFLDRITETVFTIPENEISDSAFFEVRVEI
ncbi:hypothetical protein KKG66_07270, partial [bacterium]|nr:hypothetical protein [bacterium]